MQKDQENHRHGLAVYCLETSSWLAVQRRHSISFLLILKGRYTTSEGIDMVCSMTPEEKNLLLKALESKKNFCGLVRKVLCIKVDKHIEFKWKKLHIHYNTLITALKSDKHRSRTWTWPKGIAEEGEDKIEAAIRELNEETGIDLARERYFISDESTVISSRSGGINFVAEYWLIVIDKEIECSILGPL